MRHHPTRYTLGPDHLGNLWIISPGGTEGYEFAPAFGGLNSVTLAERTLNSLNKGQTTPGKWGLEASDPPPELVGGTEDDETATVHAGGRRIRTDVVPAPPSPSIPRTLSRAWREGYEAACRDENDGNFGFGGHPGRTPNPYGQD
jgi:hypothetical protein